jgi:hypothetical protein
MPASDVLITHCILHDAQAGFSIDYGPGWTNFEYSHCTVYNCNWGGHAGDHGKGCTLTGLRIHDNYFHDWSNWDDSSGNNINHHNGFYGWAESGGRLRNVRAYANLVGPHYGQHASSGLFFSGNIGDILVYNNIMTEDGILDAPDDGLVFIWAQNAADGKDYGVYNNTFVGGGAGTAINFYNGMSSEQTIYEARNNIATGMSTFVTVFYNTHSTLVSDCNLGFNLSSDTNPAGERAFSSSPDSSSRFLTFEQWQLCGFDSHSRIADPKLTGIYKLEEGSPAISAGANLSKFFGADKSGMRRPDTTPWDLGAFQFEANHPVSNAQQSK